jgi:Glycosyltransferase family 92
MEAQRRRETRPYDGSVGENRWANFIDWARRARAKPSFDAEERDYRLAVAAAVRDLIQLARQGRPLAPDAVAAVVKRAMDSRYTIVPVRPLRELVDWAAQDEATLARALRAFTEGGDDPVARLEGFLAEVERGPGDDRYAGAFLLGALLNFAVSPERVPMARGARYARLRELLGEQPSAPGTPVESYRRDLAFAHEVEASLREAGVAIRDMTDVDSLLRICATEEELWAGAGDAADSRRAGKPDTYLGVCMIYRNEARYLAEWLEFHLLVGVERFFLYDNDSDDEHRDVLAPYLDAGLVVLHDWPGSSQTGQELNAVQMGAYEHCIATHPADARWIAVIDADEFLFSPTGRPVSDVLSAYERWPAVAVNTRRFAPPDRDASPDGLVVERQTRLLDTWKGRLVKSIVDPSAVTGCINSHRFECRRGATVDEHGYPVFAHTTQTPSFEKLQINHYFVRSEAELNAKHARRVTDRAGYGAAPPGSEDSPGREATGEHDVKILEYATRLRAALNRRAAVPS